MQEIVEMLLFPAFFKSDKYFHNEKKQFYFLYYFCL